MDTTEPSFPIVTVKTLTDKAINIELLPGILSMLDVKKRLQNLYEVPSCKMSFIRKGALVNDADAPVPSTTYYWFYYEPAAILADPIDTASEWDTKNRMKVFKGMYHFSQRQFDKAAPLLVDAMVTFADVDFISFKDCVFYACIAGILAFDRPSLQKSLIKSPEVLEVINGLPSMENLLLSFYNCTYAEFFSSLAEIESTFKEDWLVSPHTQYILKELRIRAYAQILESYSSLSLNSMAQSFGVTVEFIDA